MKYRINSQRTSGIPFNEVDKSLVNKEFDTKEAMFRAMDNARNQSIITQDGYRERTYKYYEDCSYTYTWEEVEEKVKVRVTSVIKGEKGHRAAVVGQVFDSEVEFIDFVTKNHSLSRRVGSGKGRVTFQTYETAFWGPGEKTTYTYEFIKEEIMPVRPGAKKFVLADNNTVPEVHVSMTQHSRMSRTELDVNLTWAGETLRVGKFRQVPEGGLVFDPDRITKEDAEKFNVRLDGSNGILIHGKGY